MTLIRTGAAGGEDWQLKTLHIRPTSREEMTMFKRFPAIALTLCVAAALAAQPQPSDKPQARRTSRRARLPLPWRGWPVWAAPTSPSFSPDGKWVSFISNISGAPQVWIVPAEGGYPRMVTNGDDPVTEQQWSPASDWIARWDCSGRRVEHTDLCGEAGWNRHEAADQGGRRQQRL